MRILLVLLIAVVGLMTAGAVNSPKVNADAASACRGESTRKDSKGISDYSACVKAYNEAPAKFGCPATLSRPQQDACDKGQQVASLEKGTGGTFTPGSTPPAGSPGSASAQGSGSGGGGSGGGSGGSSNCDGGGFLAFPTWHKYLTKTADCAPQLTTLSDIWLIVLAVIDILLRIVFLVSIGFVMYGGFKYITARGNPDKSTSAKNTVTDAIVGLIIAIVASATVTFIAGRIV